MEKSESEMFALMQKKSGLRDFTSINEVLSNVISEIEAATLNKGKINGLRTGFTDLDNMLTGLHGGELLLVAARPAMGKTAFVLNIAHHVAFKEKVPVVIFSLEMSAEQLVTRLVSVDSMVEAKSLKTGEITDDDWIKIVETTNNMAGADLFIDDNSSITIAELRTKCRKLHQTKNIGLIIIDYLQLMNSSTKVESRQLFIAEVSRALKGLAKELNVPVIALSQLSRATEQRTDKRPQLADLRDSGSIEQDADIVMFIYRSEYYASKGQSEEDVEEIAKNKGEAEIIIAKQRSGPTGTVNLLFQNNIVKFKNKTKTTTEF
jgi:replicative DNA helicase